LIVFGVVSNAFDRQNPCCTDFSYELEDDGAAILEHEYRNWLPLIPNVGVLWKF
jgi:hypothetical protein